MTKPIKKFIKLNNHANDVICFQYIPKKAKVTIGGAWKLQERMFSMYLSVFQECDGEPQFYEVVRGKCRLDFTMTYKQYLEACERIKETAMDIETTDSFGRLM